MVVERANETIGRVKQVNPLTLFKKGRQAAVEIPGMKKIVVQGFAVNFVVYLLAVVLLNLMFYRLVHVPVAAWLAGLADWAVSAGSVVLWIVQAAMMLVSAFFSIRISLKFMGFRYEYMAEHVVNHYDPRPEEPFSLAAGLLGLGTALIGVAKEIGLAVGLVMLGFVPVIGAVLVFLGGSYLMGRSIADPFQSVMKGRRQPVDLHLNGPATMALGWGQMLLALIPMVGWLLLPVATIYQVIGFADLHARPVEVTGS